MFVIIENVISWFSDILGTILNLSFPNGNGGYIKLRSIIIFLFLSRLAWQIIKMFLVKGHLNNANGKD